MTTGDKPGTGWISMRHLQHIVARGEAAGLHVEEILQQGGLARSQVANADGQVPLAAIESMLAALGRRYGDPLLGLHLASDIQPATFGALGYILQACNSFADVLDVVVRFNGLLSNIGHSSVLHAPGIVEIRWECRTGSPLFRRHAVDYVLGSFAVLARLMVPETARLLQAVHLAHPRPDDPQRVHEYFSFFQCPVHFGKECSSLLLPASVLRTRLHHGDALVKELLERHARELLRQREKPVSLADDVRQLLLAMTVDGMPGKEAVAAQLGMSGRSLHRKLQEAGTGYREILDSVRLELARDRLRNGDDALAVIADQLGFSSHQAFLRWFRETTGMTPGEFRKQATTEPPP